MRVTQLSGGFRLLVGRDLMRDEGLDIVLAKGDVSSPEDAVGIATPALRSFGSSRYANVR